jgi:hypothetical protein
MVVALNNRPYPFNAETTTVSGEFSRLDKLIEDAVNEAGEKNAAVLIAKYANPLRNAANKAVDDVNRHPYFLTLLEPACQFPDGVASVVADDTEITIMSGFGGIGPYVPLRLRGVGYGLPPGDIFTYTLTSWINGQAKLRVADAPHTTNPNCVIRPLYRGRISRYVAEDMSEFREVGDRVMIEGIKYYWAIDRDMTTRPQNVNKQRAQYFTELNTWLGQLRNVMGILEIDHDQRGADY